MMKSCRPWSALASCAGAYNQPRLFFTQFHLARLESTPHGLGSRTVDLAELCYNDLALSTRAF